MKEKPTRFCCASLGSLAVHTDLAISRHPDVVSEQAVNRFLLGNVPQLLTSVGEVMSQGAATNHLALWAFQRRFDSLMACEYLKDTTTYLDSGGYQVQRGFLRLEKIADYCTQYHEFLERNDERFGRAFTLDLAPGPNACTFDSARQIYDFNIESYGTAAALPETIREKLLCVAHFRGPQLYRMWRRLLFGDGFASSFGRFAVGGLAVLRGNKALMPCVPYAVPLTDILLHAKARGLTNVHFHVLGASEPHQTLAHCFVERHVKEVHGIELDITNDSTGVFARFAKGRVIWLPDTAARSLKDVSVASDHFFIVDPGRGSREERFYKAANEALLPTGMGPFDAVRHPVYDGRRTTTLGFFLGALLSLNGYARIDAWCDEAAEDLYPIYRSGDIPALKRGIRDVLVRLDGVNSAESAAGIGSAIAKALDLVGSLDRDRCTYLVDRHLALYEHPIFRQTPLPF